MKRLLACFLIVFLSVSLFACNTANSDDTPSQQNTTDSSSTEAATTEDRSALDDLGNFDFEEHEFKILNRMSDGWTQARLDFAELTGELFDDEVFLRNRKLEDRFNIKISMVETTNHTAARPILLAGTNDYDLYTSRNAEVFTFAQEGIVNSISDLEYIDLSKKYWNDFLTSQYTIVGKQYFAIGDFDFSSLDYCFVMVFNKQLLQNYGLDDPYQLVKNGTWTYDNFAEMCKAGTIDLDGNSVMDNKDAWGFVCRSSDVLPGFWVGGGVTAAAKDKDDIPQNMMGTEKFISAIDKIFDAMYANNTYLSAPSDDMKGNLFTSGDILFYGTTLFNLKFLRNMETDFGILPYPKLTEEQELYYTRLGGGELFFTAKSASKDDLDRTGIILEAMACESRKTCLPAYYDLMLKTKLARDVESEEIIDDIVGHRVLDWIDNLWVTELRDGSLANMFRNKTNTIVSLNDSMDSIFTVKRDKMVEAFLLLP